MRVITSIATLRSLPIEIRFWAHVDVSGGKDQCWPWRGPINSSGYGVFKFHADIYLSHRFAWELTNGKIPDGMFVCHHCDNPPCCNPAHLFIGTPKDNAQDAMKKGRLANKTRDSRFSKYIHKFITSDGIIRWAVGEYDVKTNKYSRPMTKHERKITGKKILRVKNIEALGTCETRRLAFRRARYLFSEIGL